MLVGVALATTTPITYSVEIPPQITPEVIDIEQYVRDVAREYGINETEFVETLRCESGLEIDIQSQHTYKKDYPEWGVEAGDRELSFGIAQIHIPSWPGVTQEQANDPSFSVPWAAQKFKEGLQGRWTCWRTLYEK